jgi:hypothetical protein
MKTMKHDKKKDIHIHDYMMDHSFTLITFRSMISVEATEFFAPESTLSVTHFAASIDSNE